MSTECVTLLELPAGSTAGDLVDGKYRLERVIGAGGMGVVWQAMHLDLERRVAIKIVREELIQREEVVARVLLEARASAKIRSDHVARVLDVGRLPSGAPFIVMELLEGEDFSSLLMQKGRLPLDMAVDFMLQACEAIAAAHAAAIVHRDLKPENLFLTSTPDGTPLLKVLDFGISKQLNGTGRRGLTNPSTAAGSPHYMAPEQMRSASEVDPRADVWALGAILYELVSGISPFEADTIPGVCARVLGDDPVPLSTLDASLPEALGQAVSRCLEKNRENRWASVAEFAAAIAPFASATGALGAERVARVAVGLHPSTAAPDHSHYGSPSPLPSSLAPAVISRPTPVASLPAESPRSKPPGKRWRRSAAAVMLTAAAAVAGATFLRPAIGAGLTESPPMPELTREAHALNDAVFAHILLAAREHAATLAAPEWLGAPVKPAAKRRSVRSAWTTATNDDVKSAVGVASVDRSGHEGSAEPGPELDVLDTANFGGRH